MAQITTKGTCRLCDTMLGKRALANHLTKCAASNDKGTIEVFDLLIEADGMPFFWLYVTAQADATLKDLDQFLRDIWLECCGHLSVFRIGRTQYFVPGAGLGGKSMKAKLGDVLSENLEFSHEYDFGDTTYLTLKVLSKRTGEGRKKVTVLARNEMPPMFCDLCSQPATQLCQYCLQEMTTPCRFCEKCVAEHEEHEDYLMPAINSPRSGACGYEGPSVEP